jgi:hypothetical protein
MADQVKRQAQEALYAAIQSQAETNMKAAMSAADKAALLRDLAEAYRLTAGGSMPDGTGRSTPLDVGRRPRKSSESSSRQGRREG